MLRCASTQERVRFKDLETTEVWKFLNKQIRESKGVLQPNRGWRYHLARGLGNINGWGDGSKWEVGTLLMMEILAW